MAAVLQGRSAIAAHERVARAVAARDPEALLFLSPATEQAALLPSLYAQCAELADDSWFFRRPRVLEFDCRELQAYGPEEPPGEEALVQGLQAGWTAWTPRGWPRSCRRWRKSCAAVAWAGTTPATF